MIVIERSRSGGHQLELKVKGLLYDYEKITNYNGLESSRIIEK